MNRILFLCFSFAFSALSAQTNSVLSSGDWYKIPITKSGVYQLDYSFFSGLGLTNVNASQIRIFSNGGGMLPQSNAEFRFNDLKENPIEVEKQSGGTTFSAGDYVLLYAEGPHNWKYRKTADRLEHKFNLYSDTAYIFLNVNQANGLRIANAASPSGANIIPVNETRGVDFYEWDKYNLTKSGRYWLGELFDYTLSRNFSLYTPNAAANQTLKLRVAASGRSKNATRMYVKINGNLVGTASFARINNVTDKLGPQYVGDTVSLSLNTGLLSGDSLKLSLEYDKSGDNEAQAYLDWLEVEYPQQTSIGNKSLFDFYVPISASGDVGELSLANAASYKIWDVTRPTQVENIAFSPNGNSAVFRFAADSLRHFIAFKNSYLRPSGGKKIANQNLHGMANADYLIITHPDFYAAAQKLGQWHTDFYGHSIQLAMPAQIYNEFSAGRQDPTAIRDFVKMMYDQTGGAQPKYVLLMGDGSYDYKNHLNRDASSTNNFIPTYQSRHSHIGTATFTSDDYFAILSNNEGNWGEGSNYEEDAIIERNTLDVAIGRLPVQSAEEANAMVDKIISYASSPAYLGAWKNKLLLIADYKTNEAIHTTQSDGYTSKIQANAPQMNIDKLFIDNYPAVVTGSGVRYPEAKRIIQEKLNEGAFVVNYTGHGGETAWSNSDLLNATDINNMTNQYQVPAMITATCEFGRFDDPELRCGAEMLQLNTNGGAIAMFTTVRVVFAGDNQRLNDNFYDYLFTPDASGKMRTVGEIMRLTKNATYLESPINTRNFTLLADPGMTLTYPQYKAIITDINDKSINSPTQKDTLAALSIVTIKGNIQDANGNLVSDYNGNMKVTVFDKPAKFVTIEGNVPFAWQKNRLFNGQATVENGKFEFQFAVPIDISYDAGAGKISLYAENGSTDATGYFNNLYIQGTDPNGLNDTQGPLVQLFINDENWRDGGVTNPNPDLFAIVADQMGINTTGAGIGHEITAVLDGDEANPLVLNDYYAAKTNTYTEGEIRYNLKDLSEGSHTLKIRVWDVANNYSEDETTFILSKDPATAITALLAYPNPMKDHVTFSVGHNLAGKEMEVSIDIINAAGQRLQTVSAQLNAEGNYFNEVSWDGNDQYGNPIASGVYIYQVVLKNKSTGEVVQKGERIVILR